MESALRFSSVRSIGLAPRPRLPPPNFGATQIFEATRENLGKASF